MGSKKQYPLIDYTSRDFNSIRDDLLDYARRYYPNSFKDFSESGFGSLMIDSTAYIGDILSFYLDYSVNESFLDTAVEYNNVIKLGKQMGYKFNPTSVSAGEASFYIIIPASTTGDGPDLNYAPILKRGTELSSVDGNGFTLNEDVNFANPNNERVVAEVNSENGAISSFAVKATGQIISGRVERQQIINNSKTIRDSIRIINNLIAQAQVLANTTQQLGAQVGNLFDFDTSGGACAKGSPSAGNPPPDAWQLNY